MAKDSRTDLLLSNQSTGPNHVDDHSPATQNKNSRANLSVLKNPTKGPDPFWFIEILRAKDLMTGNHSLRVFEMADEWLADLEKHGLVTNAERSHWALAALLHDVGKIGVSDHILTKGDSLDPSERVEIEKHVSLGYEMIRDLPNLSGIADLIRSHHERWDGNGYPFRVSGERIPRGARFIAIVDAFDAMTGERPYRNSLNEEDALKEILACTGSQFCPQLAPDFVRFRRARRQ